MLLLGEVLGCGYKLGQLFETQQWGMNKAKVGLILTVVTAIQVKVGSQRQDEHTENRSHPATVTAGGFLE